MLEDYVVNQRNCFALIGDLHDSERVKGIILTRNGEKTEFHFLSRYFAHMVGLNEDPVTGSPHTVLGPYWKQDYGDDKIAAFSARQCSKRGATLR